MLTELLGFKEPVVHALDWHDRIVAGFFPSSVKSMAKGLRVKPKDICELVGLDPVYLTPEYKKTRLSTEHSNYLYRLGVAFSRLMVALKSESASVNWLRTQQVVLKGRIPVLLLATHQGSDYTFTAIERIPVVQPKVTPRAVEYPADTEHDAPAASEDEPAESDE